jgi:hypothetical protein
VGFTETESVEGTEPDVGETTSHVAADDAVQESVPPAAFVMEMLCAAGTAAPTMYVKLSA